MPLDTDCDVIRTQRDILFNGLKKLVRSDSTPENIKAFLNDLGRKVVATKKHQTEIPTNAPIIREYSVGDTVTTINNDICRYMIDNIYEENDTKLCTLRTIWVKDNKAPVGSVHHNIPTSILKYYKGV